MKNILRIGMLLCMFLLGSVGWAMAQNPVSEGSLYKTGEGENASVLTFKTGTKKDTLFANGNPIRIELSEESKLKISVLGKASTDATVTDDYFTCKNDAQLVVIGGKCSDEVESTFIEMKSGKLSDIIAGGFGYGDKNGGTIAKVTGTATLIISGGEITNKFVGGGAMYSDTKESKVKITGKDTKIAYAVVGPFANGGHSGNNINTTYEQSNCRVDTVSIETDGGEITCLYVGGGQGHAYTKKANANLKNTKITEFYMAGSNGHSDDVTVVAESCTFTSGKTVENVLGKSGNACVIGGVVRARIENSLSVTFKNCNYPTDGTNYFTLGAMEAWAGTDTNGSDENAPYIKGTVKYTFTGESLPTFKVGYGLQDANLRVIGAPASIAPVIKTSAEENPNITAFSLSKNNKWTFNDGLSISDNVTFTNNGTLEVAQERDVNNLYALFEAGASTIILSNQTYTLPKQLVIKKPMTLFGNNAILQADPSANWPTKKDKDNKDVIDTSKANLISVEAGPDAVVTFYNVNVKNSKAAGINVQTAENVTLSCVTSMSNATAGLLVHAPVDAYSFQTAGNVWGGVNIDKGNNGSDKYDYKPSFKFDANSSFAEANKIWAELVDKEASAVVMVPDNSWTAKKGENDSKWFWTNSVLTTEKVDGVLYVFANGNAVTVSATDDNNTKIAVSESDFLVCPNTTAVYLYGGSKDASVTSTSITMTGGSLTRIYGGGYGSENTPANVTGTAKIEVKGGTVSDLMVGGGDQFARVDAIDIDITGASTTVQALAAGGFAHPAQTTLETQWSDKVVCGAQTVNIYIKDATLPEGLGCGGGQGWTYTGTSTVQIENAKLGSFYGVLYNGYADQITATLTGCTFYYPTELRYSEFGTINRGKVGTGNFTFNNCNFTHDNQPFTTFTIGAIEGWGDSDTTGDPAPAILGSVSYTFTDCTNVPNVQVGEGVETADVTLTGAPALLKQFRRGTNIATNKGDKVKSSFEIPAGKTWTFNGGLTFAEQGESETAVTLTNNGTIVIPAASVHAVASKAAGTIVVTPATTMAAVVTAMNNAENKSNLQGKTFSIECQDGVIASNKSVAAELAAAGKVVKVLNYTDPNGYSLSEEAVQEAAKITNLPDSVAYGTQPITLAFNRTGFTASIIEGSDFASITDNVLTINKPGEVTIKLSSGSEESAETYTQKLKVTKRIVTLTRGLEVDYDTPIDGVTFADDKLSKIYDGTTKIGLKLSETIAFSGLVEGDDITIAAGYSGVLADANVGYDKPVIVTASLSGTKAAYYQLAPVAIVKATVIPKPLTITAKDQVVSYGGTVPFEVESYLLIGSDKLEGTLKFSCAVKTDTTAGDYADAIKPYGLTSPNYAITFKDGNLTVTAIAPSIEITEAKVVTADTNKNIELKARLIHNGGVSTAPTVSFKNGETTVSATLDNGIYSGKIENVQKETETTYLLKAVATNSAGNGEASVSLKVDALTPQNLSWAPSVLPTLVYGQTMTLAATSDRTAATGAYTYSVVSGENATIENGVLKATKVGKVTIEAKRAADSNYSAATLTKTIEITPKPITVSISGLEKVYDGTTTIATPAFTLSGVEGNDAVAVNTYGVTLSYASKNAGDNIPVILPELTLTGAAADNYTLVQPTNVTGKITKAPLTIKVKDVTRPWNQRHTKYEFETNGLVKGETLAQAYTGNLNVTENGNKLVLSIDATKSQNYNVTAQNGTLTITKGMPKAVVYGSEVSGWKGMIVDYQGYATNELELDDSNIASGSKALVKLKNGPVLTSSINSKPTPTSSASLNAASYSLRAASLRATTFGWDGVLNQIEYGSEAQDISYASGYNYESTNMSVLTYSGGKITPVGVGNATIIATKTDGTEVHICNFTVLQKEIGLTATMNKTYDGTTTATGTVSLGTGIVGTDDVALDLSGISFNYDNKNVGTSKLITPSQPLVLIGTNANNYTIVASSLTGTINAKEITVNNPIAVYYNGQTVHTLNTYPVSGLITGDVAPIKVTFADAAVGTPNITIALTADNEALNYRLASSLPVSGTIQRSTLVATLPASASSVADLNSRIQLQIRETGETVTANAVGFNPTITTSGSGANTVYYVTGGETDNYSVVYDRNQLGYAAPVTPGGGGGTVDPDPVIPTVSNPVVAERTATTAAVTWEKVSGATSYKLFLYAKKTDSTPLKTYEFDKDGKLKATAISFTLTGLEEGKAYYVETAAYNALGTLLVKKSVELSATPTGIEAISEGSQLYTVKGAIVVAPAEPLQVAIYSVTGQTLFNDEVSYLTQVPAQAGIYVVVIQKGKERITEKVFVK